MSATSFSCSEYIEPVQIEHFSPNMEGILSFKSLEDFKDFNNKFNTMTDIELDAWEKANNYVSYRTILKQAYEELESASTEEENKKTSEKYSDILILKDDRWVPLIEVPFYQTIANRKGIYGTDEYLNKVVGDHIMTVNKNDFKKLENFNLADIKANNKTLKEEGVKKYRYMNSESTANSRILNTCSTDMVTSYFKNPSGCKNDRKVFLSAKSYISFAAFTTGDFFQPRATITVWGEKRRGTWCDWFGYATSLSWRNVSYTISAYTPQPNGTAIPTVYSKVIPNHTSPNDYSYIRSEINLGAGVFNQHITAFPFTKLHAEGTSRGVGDIWVSLDCQ